MDTTLQTEELKYYILEFISTDIAEFTEPNTKTQIHFEYTIGHNVDGVYAYSDDNKYHFIVIERGKIIEEKHTDDILDITYWCLDNYIFDLSLKYATTHKESNKDFRRQLFKRELEIWNKIGVDFYIRKQNDIQEILQNNPYID